MSKEQFISILREGYTFEGDKLVLGAAVYQGETLPEVPVSIPLSTLNRHGLIAGATGTGKTKTLQMLAEQMSAAGIPSLLMDIKGDLSGIAAPGTLTERVKERHESIGIPFTPQMNPVEFLSISQEMGAPMRATVSEFGPVLFSKILELNETQQSVVAVLFKYADDKSLPLLDLKDFKKLLQFATEEGKEEISATYGTISSSTTGIVLRKIIELEQQGAESFFGEMSFDVDDLLRLNEEGKGYINVLRLTDIPDRPKLFSTFMLCLLAEMYARFPEEGDLDRPKLAVFIDEAHLIFDEASEALLDQVETIIKLIRSKGVGVFFCTQSPDDIPEAILGQLGLKIQHSLRAFTAKDRKAIRSAAENYPVTAFYEVDELLTNLGIGEALVTALNEKGTPTPLVHCVLRAPASRMDVLEARELETLTAESFLAEKYREMIDRESAYEMLQKKMTSFKEVRTELPETKQRAGGQSDGSMDSIGEVLNSSVGRVVVRELTRGLLGILGLGGSRSRRR